MERFISITVKLIYKFKEFLKELRTLFQTPKFNQFLLFFKRPRILIWFFISSLFSFAISNPLNTLILVFVGANFFSVLLIFIIDIITFLLLISFFSSSFVERFLRALESVRRVATQTEKQRLLPLFWEVYSEVCKKEKYISRKIKLYIVDSVEVNAFIIGRNTVAITRGAINTFDDEQIKGLFAHEFAHLVHCDGQITILLSFCSSLILYPLIFLQCIFFAIATLGKSGGFISNIFNFLQWVAGLAVNIVVFIWTLITSGGSRKKEYMADNYAITLGYGVQLKSALYKLYEMQVSDKMPLIKRLQQSHPVLAYRIEKLEEVI